MIQVGVICRLGSAEEAHVRAAVAMAIGQLSPDACRGDERLRRAAAAISACSACSANHSSCGNASRPRAHASRREGQRAGSHLLASAKLGCVKLQALQPFAEALLQLEPEPAVQVSAHPGNAAIQAADIHQLWRS